MNILIVAAHPDDEVLGCAGTVSRLIREGNLAYTFHFVGAYSSRDTEQESPESMSVKANGIMGVSRIFPHQFPDQKLDTVPFLELVKAVEKVKNEIKPDIIFTHYEHDLNLDHQLAYKAVVTATRPMKDETVKQIYSFEIPSSTEWGYPLSFSPDAYFNILTTWKVKEKALKAYGSELREFPHPRSLEGIKILAKYRGMTVGIDYAEAFKTVRNIC